MQSAIKSLSFSNQRSNLSTLAVVGLALALAVLGAHAATNTGTALQAAYNQLNDMVNGYGKQLLTVCGFGVALIGYMAANATSIVMKFVGFCIFGGVGLGAAITVMGALV